MQQKLGAGTTVRVYDEGDNNSIGGDLCLPFLTQLC